VGDYRGYLNCHQIHNVDVAILDEALFANVMLVSSYVITMQTYYHWIAAAGRPDSILKTREGFDYLREFKYIAVGDVINDVVGNGH